MQEGPYGAPALDCARTLRRTMIDRRADAPFHSDGTGGKIRSPDRWAGLHRGSAVLVPRVHRAGTTGLRRPGNGCGEQVEGREGMQFARTARIAQPSIASRYPHPPSPAPLARHSLPQTPLHSHPTRSSRSSEALKLRLSIQLRLPLSIFLLP